MLSTYIIGRQGGSADPETDATDAAPAAAVDADAAVAAEGVERQAIPVEICMDDDNGLFQIDFAAPAGDAAASDGGDSADYDYLGLLPEDLVFTPEDLDLSGYSEGGEAEGAGGDSAAAVAKAEGRLGESCLPVCDRICVEGGQAVGGGGHPSPLLPKRVPSPLPAG